MTEGDALRLLGIGSGATEAEVRAAFRRKVMERHPDTALEETAGPDVQALVDAYRLLIGSEARSEQGSVRRFGERWSARGRRIEVNHRSAPDTPRSTGSMPRCPGCGGVGLRTRVSTCPGCHGAGRVTIIDSHRVRVSPCRNCQGRGRVRTLEICELCGEARR